jgi:hypothetical protein
MRYPTMLLATVGFLVGLAALACAASTATQTVNFRVDPINDITVSGNPATLAITSVDVNGDPVSVTDASTTYSFTTNVASRKITGQISAGGDMPTGLTLSMALADPGVTGWSSAGNQVLASASAVTLASGGKGKASGKAITYALAATSAADAQNGSRTVTLTITNQ